MRAAVLIIEVAGGKITSDVVDVYPKKIADHQVFLQFESANRLIGQEIPKETIKGILTSLDIKIENVTETGIGMTIPAYRNDVTREVDVIEEILRVYGYNNIDFTSKLNASIAGSERVVDYQIQNKIGDQLTALGFYEILCNSLTNPSYTDLTESVKAEHNVTMLNPLSQDLEVMRQSMLFGALEAVSYNSNRKMPNVKLFEFGRTYHNYKEREERKHLSLTIAGDRNEMQWSTNSSRSDFYYGKGAITAILQRLGIDNTTEKGLKSNLFSEGISVWKNNQNLVELGIVNKKITKHFNIDSEVFFADFNWGAILDEIPKEDIQFKSIPKFPKVKRDFALLLDDSITFESLKTAALKTENKLLKEVSLFDVYTGKNLPKGKKSYALSFTLQDDRKTLTDKQIDKIMGKLQQRFEADFGAELR
jgi:phenylalanyl-tRNA synthetase beta chain